MGQRFYQTGQFAEKAAVSVRTLRYYDKVGLLSPAQYTESGYRLYTDADFARLQQILALKLLGFSLEEIHSCLRAGPTSLRESLAQQKAMMQEKRRQLDTVIQAIDETEKLLATNINGTNGDGHNGHTSTGNASSTNDWEPVVRVIQVIHMQQSNDWRNKYLTDEQLKAMDELSQKHYTDEQRQNIAEWGKNWSEADQQRATQRWNDLSADVKRIMASGQTPDSPEAQALVQRWQALIQEFTHGDSGVLEGLKGLTKEVMSQPAGQRPYQLPFSKEEMAFLVKGQEIAQKKQGS